jgi:hypothetical protein
MYMTTAPYLAQRSNWPLSGRSILAHYDDTTIVVYQAYKPSIGHFAATHGYFGGEFSLSRMSWIKPNFLWMMARSEWAMKDGQTVILAIRLQRPAFDMILSQAVPSRFVPELYASEDAWRHAVAHSNVRIQWDPDHDPYGKACERRAIQLGLRGEVLARYAREWIVNIEDITPFVHEQYRHVQAHEDASLMVPQERVYPVFDTMVATRLGLSSTNGEARDVQ